LRDNQTRIINFVFMPPWETGFDTSAINKLKGYGSTSEPIIAALKSGLRFVLPGTSVEEIFATESELERNELRALCARLLVDGKCIWPADVILKELTAIYQQNPLSFNWQNLDVAVYSFDINRGEISDEFSAAIRKMQVERKKLHPEAWRSLASEVQPIFKEHPGWRPKSFADTVLMLRDWGSITHFAQLVYQKASGHILNEHEINAFFDACPPFRASIYGRIVMPFYDRCIRHPKVGPSFAAERSDLITSGYLAYCDRFVTADEKQERCLREVALAAEIKCEVISYEKFCSSLMIGGMPPTHAA
jgi:hypothetical protein